MQAVGVTRIPEELVQLRNTKLRIVEGFNAHEDETEASINGEEVKIRRSPQAVASMKRYTEELGKPQTFLTVI